jgi:energy-coupling factor transporter transmembrane protein EcfT
MNKDNINKSIFWLLLYIFLYGVCTVIVSVFFPETALLTVGIVGVIYILLNIFGMKYKRERLFLNGIIGALSVMFIGSWFGKQLDLESTISIGAAVTAMDIISFTKIGKRTVNAKAMSNKTVAAKLFVYGLEKNDVLIPTCGYGDYLYYAMWISGIHALSSAIQVYVIAALMIFLGIIIQSIVVKRLSGKDNFKGFPGTVFPFLCTVFAYLGVYYFVR